MDLKRYYILNLRGMRFFKGLLPRIILAMIAGVILGNILPEWASRIFITFNGIFSQFLGFSIPLLILSFVAPAIADVNKGAGKLLLAAAGLAYTFTLIAGFGSYFISNALFPKMIDPGSTASAIGQGPKSFEPFFTIEMPPLMSVMSALILAFILGLGVNAIEEENVPLRGVLNNMRTVISGLIGKAIIPLLPLYIMGIFIDMAHTGQIIAVFSTFAKIILVIFAMHIGILIFQFCVACIFSKENKNPFKMLGKMMPAYFTALGTQSSAATIPVTLKATKSLGVKDEIADFSIPLFATIHMSGSTLKIVACAVALMITNGIHYTTPMFAGFICMLGVTIIAAPGVPGGSIMAALGILSSILRFSETDNALMIALYIAMDSFGTACNVTGDGALSVILDRLFSKPHQLNQ